MDRMTSLMALDDDCLLFIIRLLSPLPDRFALAATCNRLRNLTSHKRAWLRVSGEGGPSHKGNNTEQRTFTHLEEALSASRPGDTIWLAPHVEHKVQDVTLHFPVHLLGGGLHPEDTILKCPKGASMGLDFRATCLLANLSIQSSLAPCILHRCGQLRVERCFLTCHSGGLDHLSAPIVTVATVNPPPPPPLTALGSHKMDEIVHNKFQETLGVYFSPPAPCVADFRSGSGLGKLVVADTRLSGGGSGVHCRGSGILQDVRAIYGTGKMPLFFFEVDARCNLKAVRELGGSSHGFIPESVPAFPSGVPPQLVGIDPRLMIKATKQHIPV
ncbi:hypothetical protein CEUSTIGMA_g9461.t1 [Chlamydomonas eustigma]|uniref:F-box domain-containing protein n=1 Tax=Chlamydomonas eustigma TaxID=1157962 RepID=A0A250XG59_9CHLO|nr:hypothetical protein CEUSTIGMA_g9461.t1 [Chlamydomonas eustigma]|eukprot:GAX82033.1 hypothetical protein CEUSTIGMA_g9461.t1 [Chlamydomonas eustigma]